MRASDAGAKVNRGPRQSLAQQLVAGILLSACSNSYPIEPTFCDEFCRVTLRAGCDQEPENCVRECETGKVRKSCQLRHQALLECYQRAPDDAFVCVGSGFGSSIRVRDGVCRSERDELLTCERPEVSECLELCRPLQNDLERAASVQLMLPGQSSATSAVGDAGLNACPLLLESCETLCWNLSTIEALSIDDLYLDASAGAGDTVSIVTEALRLCPL